MNFMPSKDELLEFLGSIELFKNLKKSALKSLIVDFEPVHLKGQETLIREGDLDNDLFVVLHGRLRVFKNADQEDEEILAEIGSGQVVGEVAILVDKPRTATVKAIRDTVLVKLNKKSYDKFVEAYPEPGMNIAKACIERLLTVSKKDKTSANLSTITFIPLQDSPLSKQFIELVAEQLREKERTLLLTRELAEGWVGEIQNIFNEAEKFEKLLRYLNDQESLYRYVLYVADCTFTPWTELCARQADAIYILKDGSFPTQSSGEIEAKLLQQKSISSRVCVVLSHTSIQDQFSDVYAWIRQHEISDYYHIDPKNKEDIARIVRFITGNSVGLVLSGGGARALAHIGVIRALEQARIPIDIVGGTSAGSLVAAAYAMGFGSHEIERLCNQFLATGSSFDLTFPYISLVTGRKLVAVLKDIFGEQLIEELHRRMFCVSSNITKNEVCVHDVGLVRKAIRASLSLPGIYPPVFSGGDLLVDGGVLNNLPVEVMNKKFNAGKVIASLVLMSSDRYQFTQEAETFSGWKILFNKLNPFAAKVLLPRIDSVLMRSMTLNELKHQLSQAQQADFAFILNLGKYGLMDFKQYKNVIEEGFIQAKQMLEGLDFDKL